jgi:hypothetical protein
VVALNLTHVASSAWQAPASSTSIAPTYPAGIAEGDRLYIEVCSKPDTATPSTPANWALVGTATGGGGTAGAGTGPQRTTVFSRTVPSGGLSGSVTVTITGGSSPVACMRAFRHESATGVTWSEATSSYSRATAGTAAGGTTSGTIATAAKDAVVAVVSTADDQASTVTISNLTQTGITFGTLTQDPSGTIVNSQGNDISAASAYRMATAGTATIAAVVTATASSSETGMGFVYRVRADGTVVSVPATVTPATVAATTAIPAVTAGNTRTFTSATTTVQATGLTAGQEYRARVRARDAAGNWSGWSDVYTFSTETPPPAPAAVAATAAVPAPTVRAGADRAPAVVTATTNVPIPTVTGAAGAVKSVAVVAATAAVPTAAVSYGFTSAPAVVTAVAAIPAVTVAAGTGVITSATPVAAVAAIPAATAGLVRAFTSAGTTLQAIGLTPDTVYTARVRARDAAGNWSAYSAPVQFTTVSAGTATPATVAAVAAFPSAEIGGVPPTVAAGRARPVANGQGVLLDVTATPPGGQTISGYSWEVISGGGTLTNALTATPTYTAPGSGNALAIVRATVSASNGGAATADVTVSYHANVVAAENALPGVPRSTWDLTSPNLGGISTLQGFCDGFTVNVGQAASFKVAQSDTAGWTAEVFRLGYYGGNGARSYGTVTPTGPQVTASQAQPAPADVDPDTTRLSADCAAWSATLTWTPPSWAPSGFYILRLNRGGGGASHVQFIVRDDARQADLMFMPADSTWNAYNAWGGMGVGQYTGNSLYYGTAIDQYNADCGRYVSYNRPVVNRGAADSGRSYGAVAWSTFFTGEYPMLRFIERNGVDVKYYGCIDAAGDPTGTHLRGNGSTRAGVNAAIFVGHNEYWSDGMRAGWEAARDNGVSVFACAGNEVFWRLVGTADDAEGRPRTWECQKSTINGRGNTRPQWTGTWRDPDGAGKGGNSPENTFTGTIFVVNGPDLRSLVVPFNGGYSAQPLWRDTTVASLTTGQSYTSPSQILGFEWDVYGPAGTNGTGAAFLAAPHPRVRYCSDVTYAVSGNLLLDAGDVYGSGNATHRLVVYPGGNGAIVFGTGTINWAFGVDNTNTYQVGNDNTTAVIQQATLNILTDMGAPPATLMSGLTQPTAVDWFVDVPAATVAAVATIPAATTAATQAATSTPATVAAAASVPGPSVRVTSDRAPATVTAAAAVPAVSIPDLSAPTAPTGLATTDVGTTTIDLAWSPSSDNVGVTGYEIRVVGPE